MDIFNDLENAESAFNDLTEENASDYKKPKKENYWDKTDIKPLEIDVEKFKRTGKSFTIFTHPENDLPKEEKNKLLAVAKALIANGYTYRHGANAENVLNNEILSEHPDKVVSYLPWKKFNPNITDFIKPNEYGYRIAVGIHKAFMKLPNAVRAIIAKDTNLILGKEGNDPVDFILLWTANGAETLGRKVNFKELGNTTYILQLAAKANIPVFNLKNEDALQRLKAYITK